MAEVKMKSAADVPGRLREYETVYILRPDTAEDVIGGLNKKVRGIIETDGGKLLKVQNWGKRRLAYEIKKQLKGTYLFWSYLGKAGVVEEIERNLRITDTVIRYYTVLQKTNVDPAEKATEVDDESFAKAAVPPPDEEAFAIGTAAPPSDDEDDDDIGDNIPDLNRVDREGE